MRKLKIMEHISLDGVIQIGDSPAGEPEFPYGDWTAPYRTPAGRDLVLQEYGDPFDLLLGRRTYDSWSMFWPNAPKTPMGDRMNAATKYVATHRPDTLEWGPSVCVGADLVREIQTIKATPGPNLILAGSSTLTSIVLENRLAEEVVLLVNPVLLGAGKRFLRPGSQRQTLKLLQSRALPSGIIINNYATE